MDQLERYPAFAGILWRVSRTSPRQIDHEEIADRYGGRLTQPSALISSCTPTISMATITSR